MVSRVVLTADEGKILTNGITYGKHIFLAVGENIEDYYEISQEEYERVLELEKE